EAGFHYRMVYVEPRLIRDALAGRAHSLPFVSAAVSADARLLDALRPAFDSLDRPLEHLEADQIVLGIADALLARDGSAGGVRRVSAS
ncbi:AraC family ligand binding domain-containing protein, partial [Acinetobacter baumannii]